MSDEMDDKRLPRKQHERERLRYVWKHAYDENERRERKKPLAHDISHRNGRGDGNGVKIFDTDSEEDCWIESGTFVSLRQVR